MNKIEISERISVVRNWEREMKVVFARRKVAQVLFVFVTMVTAFAGMAISQVSDPRMDDIRRLQENNRIIDGQQKDKAKARNKEERLAIVNEAFKRLQMLHNEMMAMMSSTGPADAKKITAVAEEVKLRAIELNANLALPELPKEKEKAKAETDPASQTISEQMFAICAEIRDFVKNVNLSPTDPNAGLQSRRDLIVIVEKSDKLLASVGVPNAKP